MDKNVHIYRSPYPTVQLPNVPYHKFLLERMAQHDQAKPALVDSVTGRTLTYGALRSGIEAFGAWLLRRGFGKGQTLALISYNLPEYAIVFHGVVSTGGTLTTVNPHYTAEEMQKQLTHSNASIIFTIEEDLEKVKKAAEGRPIILFSTKQTDVAGTIPFRETMQPPTEQDLQRLHQVVIDPENDVAALPYSSGTTGLPKGVMLTHRNLTANVLQSVAAEGALHTSAVLVAVLPMYHIYGMQCIMNCGLYHGVTLITMPKYQLKDFLHVCQHYGVTRAYLVPPIILQLTKDPLVAQYDLSKLRVINSGAAPLGPELQAECQAKLNVIVKQGYGLTETSPTTHVTPDDPKTIKPASIGPLLSNTELRLVDTATGESVGPHKRGEIWMRGPQIMKGYYNNEAATKDMITEDGWLKTGDIGYADDDSYFFIVDRVKELIKFKGLQVAPAELEAALLSHPAVADAAVIGVPDVEAGEIPKAFVVLKKGQEHVTKADINAFMHSKLTSYKRPKEIEFIAVVPKSPSGKILRRELLRVELEKRSQSRSTDRKSVV